MILFGPKHPVPLSDRLSLGFMVHFTQRLSILALSEIKYINKGLCAWLSFICTESFVLNAILFLFPDCLNMPPLLHLHDLHVLTWDFGLPSIVLAWWICQFSAYLNIMKVSFCAIVWIGKRLGEPCDDNESCAGKNSVCSLLSNQCECPEGYKVRGQDCIEGKQASHCCLKHSRRKF